MPDALHAQSAIAGLVTDTSGAVLPGVTVEAASPVLIEKARTTVTDGSGRYQIVDLRPGLYSVTFTLAGFATVNRVGISLPTNFTATVSVELRLGALEETITVSTQAPVVDMRSATQQQVLNKELLDAVPTGRNLWGTGALMTGATLNAPDVGGSAGMQQTYITVHGSLARDNAIQVDGMSVNGVEGDGAIQQYFNAGMFEEMSFQTSALTAEVQGAGVRVNMIPKDGGDTFKGSLFWSHTPGAWQSDNFTDELKATGLRAPNRIERIFDLNLGLGGPVVRKRLWFYGSFRRWGVDQTITDSFYNLDPTGRTYRPDLSRPTVDDNVIKSAVFRLTYQMSPNHKLAGYADKIIKYRGHECAAPAAEESCGIRDPGGPSNYLMAQVKYTGTFGSRIMAEVGWSQNDETYTSSENQPGNENVGRVDRITGEGWSAVAAPFNFRSPIRHSVKGTVSYVTGSRHLKAGFQLDKGWFDIDRNYERSNNRDLYQEYRNGAPVSVVVTNTPMFSDHSIKYDLGVFVQDSWTIGRLVLNPGIRFEFFNSEVPAQSSPAGRFVPARQFGKIENLPNWKDVAPRVGLVYDLFGTGKTAVKFNAGKYMRAYSTGFAQLYNPMAYATDRRTWIDQNGDDVAQEGEIGPVQTPFNVTGTSNRSPSPDIKRPFQYEYSIGIQHEILPRLSVSGTWVRRDYRRILWTDNVLTTHDNYTIVNIQNPLDRSETIPVYNLNVAQRGLVRRIDTNSERNRFWYNGFDLGFTSRIGGGNLFGGVSHGRQLAVNCEVDDPNELRFCDQRDFDIPYLTQVKLAGSYPLRYGIQLSGSWQGYPGASFAGSGDPVEPWLNVNYVVDRTVIPTLTQSSVTVKLVPPGRKYMSRWNQIDVRLAKKFTIRKVNLSGQFDVFNLLNSNTALAVNQTFGSSLDRPTRVLQGRLFAVGTQVNF